MEKLNHILYVENDIKLNFIGKGDFLYIYCILFMVLLKQWVNYFAYFTVNPGLIKLRKVFSMFGGFKDFQDLSIETMCKMV